MALFCPKKDNRARAATIADVPAEIIDPHTHSTCSDGTDRPAKLVASAARAGIDILGLTDHDTTAGWEEASRAATALGLGLLRGIELSTVTTGMSVHLLIYLPRPDDAALNETLAKLASSRAGRAQSIVANLAADYPLDWEAVLESAPTGAVIGRPHIADALIARGIVASRKEAFQYLLHPRGPYFVRHWAPETAAAISLARACGGVPILAHPRADLRGRILTDAQIAELAPLGLAGLEVDHRDHSPQARAELRALARRLKLAISGGSDYHGTGKENRLGENTMPAPLLRQIEQEGALPLLRP